MAPPDGSPKRRKKRPWNANFPYVADYNDHFETPLRAYEDLVPILDALDPAQKRRSEVTLYDPYYCDGRSKVLLEQLGFKAVHEKRDFYRDIDAGQVPEHDVLVTNPPYSDQHKKHCLQFCLEQLRSKGRPFCSLMPNYVAAKQYYRDLIADSDGMLYLIPGVKYEYEHPEGTGKTTSPFESLWFCGVGRDRIKPLQEAFAKVGASNHPSSSLATSIAELEQRRVVSTFTRPNPRQRRKKKRSKTEFSESAAAAPDNLSGETSAVSTASLPRPSKKAKHRDATGKRKKERF